MLDNPFSAGYLKMTDGQKKVFVTVGTTSFDKLIKTVCDVECIQILLQLGYKQVNLQIGKGDYEPEGKENSSGPVELNIFRYKDSIEEDIRQADLVISHAGAGSCLEVLGAKKPLLVVINDDLMNNHQLELAQKLHKDGHLLYTTCRDLPTTLKTMDLSTLKTLEPGKPEKFASFLDKIMGIS